MGRDSGPQMNADEPSAAGAATNFKDGAFSPFSVTVGCTTRWMPSPLKPLL